MIRMTTKVFADLAICMIGFGLLMGIIFPFFTFAMGVDSAKAFSPVFFGACMAAGFMVGALNIMLAKNVVGKRLRKLADKMNLVESNLKEMARTGSLEKCTSEACFITVDSEDEIGDSSRAFNYLVEALASSHKNETAIRSFTEMLSSNLELDFLAGQALQQLIQHTQAGAGALLVAQEGEVKIASSQGLHSAENIAKSDYVRRALQSLNRQIVTVPENVYLEGVLTNFRPGEIIVDPIIYKGVPLGVVILASPTMFSEDKKAQLHLFCQGLALALNNALAHDRLQRLVALDPLTGIYNRRFGFPRRSAC